MNKEAIITGFVKAAVEAGFSEKQAKDLYTITDALRRAIQNSSISKQAQQLNRSSMTYWHGTNRKLDYLRAGSWVTPYKEDAAVFGVPWGSKDLINSRGEPNGRPPQSLKFKTTPPEDHPVYIYEVNGETKPAFTNTGRKYSWNRQVTNDTPVRLVKTIPSWHKSILNKQANHDQPMFSSASHDRQKTAAEQFAKKTNPEAIKRGFIKRAKEWYYTQHGNYKVPAAVNINNRIVGSPELIFNKADMNDLVNRTIRLKNKKQQKPTERDIEEAGGRWIDPADNMEMMPLEYARDLKHKNIPIRELGLGGDGSLHTHIPIDAGFGVSFPNEQRYLDQTDLKRMNLIQKMKMHMLGKL